ncbi:MAG: hypothetical protein ACTSRG_23950 [Candidatus Helarchaeota archaeon]
MERSERVAYYRWKNANVGLLGCSKHVAEIMDVLNKHKKESLNK